MDCAACHQPIDPGLAMKPGQLTHGGVCHSLLDRARNRRWAEEHRNVRRRNAWLCGAPPYGEYLPGGGTIIYVDPPPQWPIVHRNVRALHGLVTDLTDEPHDPRRPLFSLVPWNDGIGWGAYIGSETIARRVAGKVTERVLFGRRATVRTSGLWRLKAPRVTRRGHVRVRVDAVTPVCLRSSEHRSVVRVTGGNILSTLCLMLIPRVGALISPDDLRLEIVERHTSRDVVPVGGKFGSIHGWVGHVIVEANAPARWLLECASRIGLGGRTAFGFGRVRVTPC